MPVFPAINPQADRRRAPRAGCLPLVLRRVGINANSVLSVLIVGTTKRERLTGEGKAFRTRTTTNRNESLSIASLSTCDPLRTLSDDLGLW